MPGQNNKNKKRYAKSQPVNTRMEKPNDGEEYGVITRVLGGSRFTVKLQNNKEIVGKLSGRLRRPCNKRSNEAKVDGIVLVSIRDFQEKVVDIVHVFTPLENKKLRNRGMFADTSLESDDVLFETKVDNEEDENDVFDFEDI